MGVRQAKSPVTDFSSYEHEFRTELHALLHELFDPQVPFSQTEQTGLCEYCDFKRLCKR